MSRAIEVGSEKSVVSSTPSSSHGRSPRKRRGRKRQGHVRFKEKVKEKKRIGVVAGFDGDPKA
jgi:hypothetical protein